MASYDKMEWHYGGDYPKDLPKENSGTHIGMFLVWLIDNNLIGEFHLEESKDELEKVRKREWTGRDFLINMCDERFTAEDLNEEGNEFTLYYYNAKSSVNPQNFYHDYDEVLGAKVDTLYEIENSWDNYDKLKSVIDQRYKDWKTKVKNAP